MVVCTDLLFVLVIKKQELQPALKNWPERSSNAALEQLMNVDKWTELSLLICQKSFSQLINWCKHRLSYFFRNQVDFLQFVEHVSCRVDAVRQWTWTTQTLCCLSQTAYNAALFPRQWMGGDEEKNNRGRLVKTKFLHECYSSDLGHDCGL